MNEVWTHEDGRACTPVSKEPELSIKKNWERKSSREKKGNQNSLWNW